MKLSHARVIFAFAPTSLSLVANRDSLTSSIIETRANWNSLGCYIDNVSGRSLPNGIAVPGGSITMTNEVCQTACLSAGFSISGTEYAGECCKQPTNAIRIAKLTSLTINRVWQYHRERRGACARW